MHLKSLELSGFKSFAKKAKLDFKSTITAIVGPNGSGKSNVAEAFRFVLGEQSVKSMRGKKTEDLIWNGSTSVARSSRANVVLTFDNAHKLFPIDYDEVILERVAHRDGVSEYLLNKSAVRLRDIMELLGAAHIGSSGHHIISQGEADRILNVNPRERKEMIEDALGLATYQYKKEESIRKLEKTEENLKQVEGLRREIQPHLKFLKKQVERVEKARELQSALRDLYIEYFAREDAYVQREKDAIKNEETPLQNKLKELDHALHKARAVLESAQGHSERGVKLLSLEGDLRATREEQAQLARELGRIEGAILAQEKNIERATRKAETSGTLGVPADRVTQFTTDVKTTATEGLVSEQKMRPALLRLSELATSFEKTIHTLLHGSATASLDEERAELGRQKAEAGERERDMRAVVEREQKLSVAYEALKKEIEAASEGMRDAEREIFTITTERTDVMNRLATITARHERIVLEEAEMRREMEEAEALTNIRSADFKNHTLKDEHGHTISATTMAEEPRHGQEERKKMLERMKVRLEEAGGGTGEEIMKEYKEVEERDVFLERELEDLAHSKEELEVLIVDLETTLAREFDEGMRKINTEFASFFALMFGGGSAGLMLSKERRRAKRGADELLEGIDEAENNDYEEGVLINVSLPHKKIRGLDMLSGGERALTSIALIFAMSQVNPPPFIILDETDAALDEANSRRYGDMIENLSKRSQLILITHNRETMSRAGILYGVTMGSDGASQLLSIDFEEAVRVAK